MDKIKDKNLCKKYRSISCEVCGSWNEVSGHHIKSKGSGGWDVVENLIGLCFDCHRYVHDHGDNALIKKYPSYERILISKNWESVDYFGKVIWFHKYIIM